MLKVTIGEKDFDFSQEAIDALRAEIDIIEKENGNFHAIIDNTSYNISIISFNKEEKTITLKLNNKETTLHIKDKMDILLQEMGIQAGATKKQNIIKAPMPGLIIDISITEGMTVAKGDKMLILEAMKMENLIKSPMDGVVKKIHIEKGKTVDKNQLLIELV